MHHSEWPSNVLIVKNKNGKWEVCVDFANLNKSCTTDPFPLPFINQLLYLIFGYAMFSFLNAYSGYNQLWMNPEDEEKTTYVTRNGVFCYKVMSFGLKNVGATYQRLVTKLFEGLMGKIVEAYIDNIAVKIVDLSSYLNHLDLVFKCLRQHRVKLNPAK